MNHDAERVDASTGPDAVGAADADAGADADADARDVFGDAAADSPADASTGEEADGATADVSNDVTIDSEADATPPSPWCEDASASPPRWPDAGGNCQYFVDLSCAQYPTITPTSCVLGASDCLKVCTLNTPLFDCAYGQPACTIAGRFVAEAGQPVTVNCDLCPGAGRRPVGLRRRRADGPSASAIGEYFAQAAYLEAASVHAFARLAQELRAHGAPRHIVDAAEQSAKDEVRHARAMRKLAFCHGTGASEPRVAPSPARTLEQIAAENAVEGCVRETYGAILATWQSLHASDPAVRRAFSRIASDETRHAALAWAIADWSAKRLDAPARRRIARARRNAEKHLRAEMAAEPLREIAPHVGLPSVAQARVLLGALSDR